MQPFYEKHVHEDFKFPFIFHFDTLRRGNNYVHMHWHENIELLYFIEGSGIVSCDGRQNTVNPGEVAVINSNSLHWIKTVDEKCTYYCLIVDKTFYDSFELFIGDITLKNVVDDISVTQYFNIIIQEMSAMKSYYKTSVKSALIGLMVHLFRYHAVFEKEELEKNRGENKIEMIKAAITYIRRNYTKKLTIDEICSYIGFSKYYFCHEFKQITGKTVVDYINSLRCNYAKGFLLSGEYNVSECAELSGFGNLSYFCKTYKKYMGRLPSEEIVKVE